MEIGIRPEKLELKTITPLATGGCRARIEGIIFKGTHYWVELLFPSNQRLSAIVHTALHLHEGLEVDVHWETGDWRLFVR